MLLTDDGKLQHKIAHPDHKEAKTYLVQVDGVPDAAALARLQAPLDLGDFVTKPCKAVRIAEPEWLWPRNPPIRARRTSRRAGSRSRWRKARTARCGA
jgi:23S rRNA pseudouridine2457 synthase